MRRDEQRAWEEARDRVALNHGVSPTVVAAALAAMRNAGVPVDRAEQELRRVVRGRTGVHNVVLLGEALAAGFKAGWHECTVSRVRRDRARRVRSGEDAVQ